MAKTNKITGIKSPSGFYYDWHRSFEEDKYPRYRLTLNKNNDCKYYKKKWYKILTNP